MGKTPQRLWNSKNVHKVTFSYGGLPFLTMIMMMAMVLSFFRHWQSGSVDLTDAALLDKDATQAARANGILIF